ncbi:shikimate 5-dehydrogenase [Thozetella sp. PMI_491]|nr:shikimate 5-dehydrogenase [Thozetella sp. PMI_491]
MSLTVLRDADVRNILTKLSPPDISSLFSALESAFQSYSLGDEGKYQCHRQGITRPGGPTMLFMPATLSGGSSVKVVGVPPPQAPGSQAKAIVGATMIFDADGRATGVLNAAETTAFRTALGSILLYQHRERTESIVVFGAGKQALWHLRLALVLRSSDIRKVTIVNRSEQRSHDLIDSLRSMDKEAGISTTAKVTFSTLCGTLGSSTEYEGRLRDLIEDSDIIFCTTPSTEPVFPSAYLTSEVGRQKTRFISAIGSYKLDMQEIDPVFLRTVTTGGNFPLPGLYHPKHENAEKGGAIVVDSREACAIEAGELVKADISMENVLEVGELAHIRETGEQNEKDRLAGWLKSGMVVYKSVGMGIMDISISRAILKLASSRGVGERIDNF